MSSHCCPGRQNHCNSLQRRRLITGLGAAVGAAALGIPGRSEAFTWPWSRRRGGCGLDTGQLDANWVRHHQREAEAYARYIDGLRLRNISVQQVIAAHAKRRGPVWNTLPPRSSWQSIGPTLQVVDRVSRELNVPVTEVVSVYRHPAYNARCRGARRNSWHTRNYAVDVKMGASPSRVAAMARRLRDRGLFHGGVGRYWGFTHVDTRGSDVDW